MADVEVVNPDSFESFVADAKRAIADDPSTDLHVFASAWCGKHELPFDYYHWDPATNPLPEIAAAPKVATPKAAAAVGNGPEPAPGG